MIQRGASGETGGKRAAALPAALLALSLACTGARVTPPPLAPAPEPPPDPCLLVSAPDAPGETVRLALTETVSPRRAPVPTNDSERLLFRQLYEPLVALDCTAAPRPALAASWTTAPGGGSVTLTLAEDARFWDGSEVSAGSVIAAWRTTAMRAALPIDPTAAVALDRRTLQVALPPGGDVRALSDPHLAVARRTPAVAWPLGTGAYRVEPRPGPAGGPLGVALVPVGTGPEIRLERGADPRDLLDQGIDLFVTRDPLALDYAAALPGYRSQPLPWDRTYVLLSPRGGLELEPRTIEDLARDAVRGEARPAPQDGWWSDMAACTPEGAAVSPPDPPAAATRLVYPQADRRAEELAERLVSIFGSRPPASSPLAREGLVSLGLSPGDLAASLRAGAETAYLLALESRATTPCREAAALLERAPWLAERLAHPPIAPLVSTRARVVAGPRMTAVRVDGHGTPLLAPPRPPPPGEGR